MSDRGRLFQFFKYLVYALLTFNIYVFFAEEWAATAYRFSAGIGAGETIEAFAATIDTSAWVVLLLMFELETHVLDDRHFTRRITFLLHALRAICYAFIIYAFYGYLIKLVFLNGASPLPVVSDLCALVDGAWSYAVDLDEYEMLSAENCGTFSAAQSFLQLTGLTAVVDLDGYREILRLAWVDVINAGVWLLVVLILEIDVRLQERNMLTGNILRISQAIKFVIYSILLLAAIYWGVKGDFVDFWDAFLWLVAFVFIELNVFDWRQETLQGQPQPAGSQSAGLR